MKKVVKTEIRPSEEDRKAADTFLIEWYGPGYHRQMEADQLAQFRATARAEERERCVAEVENVPIDKHAGYASALIDVIYAIRALK